MSDARQTRADLAYLSSSAAIVEQNVAGVGVCLAEEGRCVMPRSRRGARKEALNLALLARDRLDTLIEALGGGERP